MKKIISFIGLTIKFFFGNKSIKKIYFYKHLLSIFFKTISLRSSNLKFFFWPIRHLGMLYLLTYLKKVFENSNYKFFLFDGALLGCIRQGAVAGRGKDLDIGMIIETRNDEKKIIKMLKNKFIIKKVNKGNFHLIHKKLNNFADLSFFKFTNKRRYLSFYSGIKKKKIIVKSMNILPFKTKPLYYEKCLIPNNSKLILKILYGDKFLTPDKKFQLFLS